MKTVLCLVLVLMLANFFSGCKTAPEYKATKESSTNYDIIDEE